MAAVSEADMPELDANWEFIDQDVASWRLRPEDLLSGNGSVSG